MYYNRYMEYFLDLFKPKNYKLDLALDKEKKTLKGVAKIKGTVKSENIKLHAVGFKVDSVKVAGKKVEFAHEDGVLKIACLGLGDTEIEIKYHGPLSGNMQGAYLSTYEYKGKTEKIVSTQFESHYAREAFPCIDEPSAKATFDLSITLPEGSDDIVIANTPIAKKDGETTIFETTPRMSTYLLAFVIGHFHSKTIKNNHGTIITTYAPTQSIGELS